MTEEIIGDRDGRVRGLRLVEVDWRQDGAASSPRPVARNDTRQEIAADLILLALGFTREGNAGILDRFGLVTDTNYQPVLDRNCMSSVEGVFVAGDLSLGASLVVRAIADGRIVAAGIDAWLQS